MHHDDEKSGFIFLMALFVLTGLASVMAVGLSRTMTEQLAARTEVANQQAFHLAEAGIDEALWEFKESGGTFTPGAPPIGEDWEAVDPAFDPPTLPCATAGTCCWKTAMTGATVIVIGFSGNRPTIRATGIAGVASQMLQVILERTHPDFGYAAFGDDRLTLEGEAAIDSYNAQAGLYDPVTNRFEHGNIGTNGSRDVPAPDLVVTSGLAEVDGTAYITAGTGVSYPSPWPDPPTATLTQPFWQLPAVQLPNPSAYPTVYGDVVIANVTEHCYEPRRYQTLQVFGTGDFVMHEGCKLYLDHANSAVERLNTLNTNEHGRFTVHADVATPVTVFIKDGGFDLDGPGLANKTLTPEKFQLYVTGIGARGQLAQTEPFYGAVYVEDPDGNASEAGELRIHMGSEVGISSAATYYGAFVAGGQLLISDGGTSFPVSLHYDESLNGLPLDGRGRTAAAADPLYSIKLWKQQ